jgi:zinc transporter ZupT
MYLLKRTSLFVLVNSLTNVPILTKFGMMVHDLPAEAQDARKPLRETGNTPRKFLTYYSRTILIIILSEIT